MKEDLLHYAWRMQRFDLNALISTDGQPISIQTFGYHNHNAGPDFTEARIKIGDTLWAGNVEMHIKASDWLKHHHQKDRAYDNVILHVVLDADQDIYRPDGTIIPCLELRQRIPEKLAASYLRLLQNDNWIPCQQQLAQTSDMSFRLWLDRLLVERLETKTRLITECLERNRQNWEESFYQLLGRSFGLHINALPFEMLTRSIPLVSILKHKNSLLQIEALLFGQAGMLEDDWQDEYPRQLQKEYSFLKNKYKLKPIAEHSWKFARLRPAAFPTIRIAQFATLLYQSDHLFSKILAVKNVKEIEHAFELKLSNYWLTHYRFDKQSARRRKTLGKATIQLFIINTIAPVLFLYGVLKTEDHFKELALKLLEELPPEKNSIIKKWESLGRKANTAYESQALLQLKKFYCSKKRCLSCAVGNQLLTE